MIGLWDCYAHVGAHREVFARDLLAQMDRCGIAHAVLVPFLNAPSFDDLLDAVHEHPDRFGAVCRFDVTAQNVTLEEAGALLSRGFLGARVALAGDDSDGMTAVLQALNQQNKVLVIHAPDGIGNHAERIARWSEQYPHLRVFVPHLGWPLMAAGTPTIGWDDGIRSPAACKNVFLGLSALYYFSQQAPPFKDTFPYVQKILQCFGPARCVLAGDYPLTLERCSYDQVWEALALAVSDPAMLEQAGVGTPPTLWGEG